MTLVLNHKQTYDLIKAVGSDVTILVEGDSGIGKTSLLYEMAADPFFANHHVVNPIDCTQLTDGSIVVPDLDRELGVSRELPNERFGINRANHRGIPGSRPVVIGLDELAKAKSYIKDALAPVIYEHRIGEWHMPRSSYVVAFTNLSMEGLGDSLQAHTRDRMIVVRMRKPTATEWIENFALPRNLHPVVILAAREYANVFESFTDYEPDGPKAGKNLARENPYICNPRATQDKWVTPRSLHACSKALMKGGNLDDTTLHVAFAGAVGRAFATVLMRIMKFGRDLPAFELVCHDPMHTPVPGSPGAQVMLAFSLLHKTEDKEQADAVARYVARMPHEEARLLFANNVSANTHKMGLFASSLTYQTTLISALRMLNA